MFPHSIRWRLNLWLGFLLVCVLTGFGFAVYQWQRVTLARQIDEELDRRIEALSAALRQAPALRMPNWREAPTGNPRRFEPGREPRLTPDAARLFEENDTNGFYYAIWAPNGMLLRRSVNAPATLVRPVRFRSETSKSAHTRDEFREMFRFNSLDECLLAGHSTAEMTQTLNRFALILLAAGSAVLAFGLGISWWLTTRAIRPVEEISAAANRIAAGNLSERIPVADPSNELGRLAGVLNSTFARLDAAFAQQKQFTADASHELRTPLAVIISETQSTLARERTASEYRETIETCHDAAQQMRRLAQSLLELARFDAGQELLDRAPVDLADATRECLELLQPLARERHITIESDLAPARLLGDADRIQQIINNLVSNAIFYNRDQGKVRVTTRIEDGSAVLLVSDTGIGINAEDLPHVFKRFYRADKSRARADGRSGLGLAICRAIVDAHGGTIDVASQPGKGTTFTVRLPAQA